MNTVKGAIMRRILTVAHMIVVVMKNTTIE